MLQKLARAMHVMFDRPIDIIIKHFENRLFELAMAVIFFGSSLMLAFSPGSVRAGGLMYLASAFSVWTLVVIFFMVGASRIIALILNGWWMPYGAYVRAAGAACGAIMWLQVEGALITFGSREGVLPFSTVTYGVLALFEAISMYRALIGAKKDGRERTLGMGDGRHRVVATYSGPELDRVLNRNGYGGPTLDQGHPRPSH